MLKKNGKTSGASSSIFDATDLKLHRLHETFFVVPRTLTTDSNCNPLESQQSGAKNLCNSAVHFVKELSGKKGTDIKERCDYLPYWLHEEIGNLYKEHNKIINSIPFIKALIEAVGKATKTIIKDKCNSLHYDGLITLDEWKIRKLLYIYFKKFDELSRDVNRTNNDKCSKHNKYLNSIDSLYKTYYTKLGCGGWFTFGPDYFPCRSWHNPNRLLPKVKTCKDQSTSGSSGFLFWPFGGGSSSSRSSSSSQVGTGKAVSTSVPKGGPATLVAGSTGAVSAQGSKLTAVQTPRPVDPATVGRVDAAGTLLGQDLVKGSTERKNIKVLIIMIIMIMEIMIIKMMMMMVNMLIMVIVIIVINMIVVINTIVVIIVINTIVVIIVINMMTMLAMEIMIIMMSMMSMKKNYQDADQKIHTVIATGGKYACHISRDVTLITNMG
ncbi:variable surface protein Vir12 [Plasmodium vivax Mauritania I]|uniref:Variable surface protein Vir12 n=1 Tax=Plasmodium vivax Mauritania I TaxID=1035515 RepID=A0A0J9TE03_PLAVI|nr:variable surface protein Vir12 [Plasmodium vivax Mauritania I]